MQTAETVILGAGVIGASVAYHLAVRGQRNIVVLERGNAPGQGSTGRATGGFRAQFSTAVHIRLSLLTREKLRVFAEETGGEAGYRPCGYLFVARRADQLAALRAALAVQRAEGLSEAVEVAADALHDLNPALTTGDLIGGTFCPTDGFVRPLQLLDGYLQAAQRAGVTFQYGQQATHLVTKETTAGERHLIGVRTEAGEIATRCVVNATGAWASEIAARVGVDLPVYPVRRQVAVTAPFSKLPETMPMTIDVEDGFHLRMRDGRVLLLWPADTAGAHPYDVTFAADWLEGLQKRARHRVPCLSEATIDRDACWAGLYEMSPDRHALVGPAPGVTGFYLVNGSSGHGVMHAPALGQLMAEILLDGGAHTLDLHALRPTRFAEGAPNTDTGIL